MIRFAMEYPGGWDVAVSLSNDSSLDQVLDAFEAFLKAAGFDAKQVKEVIAELGSVNDTEGKSHAD